jgi:hypothetical protein
VDRTERASWFVGLADAAGVDRETARDQARPGGSAGRSAA